MNALELFRKGFPDHKWALYFDRKIGKDTILDLGQGLQFETMPTKNKRGFVNRFKLISI